MLISFFIDSYNILPTFNYETNTNIAILICSDLIAFNKFILYIFSKKI
uniref:Uncharacterized protein n=1 Tax=virus sp. ctBM815 TaxID=2825806 RepID=A0A8S5RLD9_9VIRU|nr:MAG TPA: hypothetical protein [virus sp. ctBM815]